MPPWLSIPKPNQTIQIQISEIASAMEANCPLVEPLCEFCCKSCTIPCQASCGHWYCGDCILKYWSHSSPLYHCKCLKCDEQIVWLKPEASLCVHDQEAEVVLRKIRKYNLLVRPVFGYILRVLEVVKIVLHLDDPVLARRLGNQLLLFTTRALAFLIAINGPRSLITAEFILVFAGVYIVVLMAANIIFQYDDLCAIFSKNKLNN